MVYRSQDNPKISPPDGVAPRRRDLGFCEEEDSTPSRTVQSQVEKEQLLQRGRGQSSTWSRIVYAPAESTVRWFIPSVCPQNRANTPFGDSARDKRKRILDLL
jgi:hypothetical protein